ncbi:tripartite tricarboxylate transporter TctB family protein [Desulfosporosinus fructosivorans]|uniref:Tripartite tricarboxylate transporter TctB family protein n=1 Tax=Desulfosporosinus fructosivorans TaxID=2018669 RepID=A0A4Z0QXR0_9FIRM|nr:tripartite tricarboxylate transporter TctB family protein [Desulfosporosinus fructosivorans]TGE35581.1 tripartite tricarboxylate transporter TctB family protein [Desulfosporosinus fructosivorans]
MTKRKSDLLAGLVSVLVAVVFMVQGSELTERSNTFPQVLEIFLIVTGIYLITRGIRTNGAEKGVEEVNDLHWLKPTVIVLATFIYVAGIVYIGFYVCTLVYLLLGSWYLNEKGFTLSALVFSSFFSIGITVVLYLTFTVFLKVPTPNGLLF